MITKFLYSINISTFCTLSRQQAVKRIVNLSVNWNMSKVLVLTIALTLQLCTAFSPYFGADIRHRLTLQTIKSENSEWNGEVVSNTKDGRIQGCTLTQVDGTLTEWIIQVDGQEADLGKFSDAIYRKITSDAKRQKFQGFRPGTIPPHLMPTYVAFSMDECAREATLEAMQQNNIRPFDNARSEFEYDTISFSPQQGKKKSKNKSKKNKNTEQGNEPITEEQPQWLVFNTMKEAIDAGWKPGQSFSFIARNVKGQQVKDQNVVGAKSIGAGGSSIINDVF